MHISGALQNVSITVNSAVLLCTHTSQPHTHISCSVVLLLHKPPEHVFLTLSCTCVFLPLNETGVETAVVICVKVARV